jgi:type IX secretion system PorP/SprF family membrane protein
MKKFAISIVFLGMFIQGFTQQIPQYSNFLFNAFMINPANAGMKECLEARAGYRTQWVGFDDSPKTVTLSAHQRIDALSSKRNGPIHGAGITIESDNTGPTSRTALGLSYAIHLPIGRKTKISFGASVGGFQYRLDETSLNLPTPDPAIQGSQSEFVFPDIKAGIWLYGKNWFAGISGAQLTNPTLDDIGTEVDMAPHFNLMAGRIFSSGEKMSYIPAAQLKFTGNSKAALDVNFWADYDNRIALGIGFRNDDAAIAMMKFNFLDYFTVAYAYDYTFSKVRFGASNSHEIILGITACPRNEGPSFVPCNAYD